MTDIFRRIDVAIAGLRAQGANVRHIALNKVDWDDFHEAAKEIATIPDPSCTETRYCGFEVKGPIRTESRVVGTLFRDYLTYEALR